MTPDDRPIPSLQLLGDRLEAAAARSIDGAPAGARRSARRPSSPMRRGWVLAPALVAFVFVALGASVLLANGRSDSSAEAAVTSAALQRSSAAATGRFHVSVELDTGSGDARRVEADGAYDTAAGRVSESVDASSLFGPALSKLGSAIPSGLRAELVVDHGTIYGRLPGVPVIGRWFRFGDSPATGTSPTFGAAPADPSGVFELFGGVQNMEQLGTETIDGHSTTHYRGEVDLAKAYEDLSAADRQRLEQSLGIAGGGVPHVGKAPVEVWVDETGLIRKLSSEIRGSDGAATDPAFTARYTIEFRDLGAPVDIAVPAPADVTELPGLGSLLPGTTTPTTR